MAYRVAGQLGLRYLAPWALARAQGGFFGWGAHEILRACETGLFLWGVAKGSSVAWVAKFKGDKNSACKLSNGWSRSYKVIKLLLSARK